MGDYQIFHYITNTSNNPGNKVLMPREVFDDFYRSLSLKNVKQHKEVFIIKTKKKKKNHRTP